MKLHEYTKLKKRVEDLQRSASKADGALDQLMDQLKEFDCDNVEQAKALRSKLKQERWKLEVRFSKQLAIFEDKLARVSRESGRLPS